jgi:antitoxin component of MazEF toxin-antitoxin module
VELEQKIKLLAETKAFGITKLIRIGGSYGITLPKIWVDFNAVEVEGDYYCRIEVENNALIFRPITQDDLEGIVIKEKR